MVKGNFPKYKNNVFIHKQKFSGKKITSATFQTTLPSIFLPEIKKSNEAILQKVQKTLFLSSFWPKYAQKLFFQKSSFVHLCHILGIAIFIIVQKIRKN